jgi:riboflavin synthase
MFTGIVEEIGTLNQVQIKMGKRYFKINCDKILSSIKIGDSVACNGICLTVIEFSKDSILVEAMNETLQKTSAVFWKINDKINLERAMSANGRFDGHIVQGHIDTTGKIISKTYSGRTIYYTILFDSEYSDLIVPQGSISLNGISLTLSDISNETFTVAIISHTYEMTNLALLKENDIVNIEFDILGKYILRQINHNNKNKITQEWLIEKGF